MTLHLTPLQLLENRVIVKTNKKKSQNLRQPMDIIDIIYKIRILN